MLSFYIETGCYEEKKEIMNTKSFSHCQNTVKSF